MSAAAYRVTVRRGGRVLHDETVDRLIEADLDFRSPFVYRDAGDKVDPAPCTAHYWANVIRGMVGPGYSVTVETV